MRINTNVKNVSKKTDFYKLIKVPMSESIKSLEENVDGIISKLRTTHLDKGVKVANLGFYYKLIDSEDLMILMLDSIKDSKMINIDFEGINLCKIGKVCLAQVHASKSDTVFIIDFITMNPFEVANGRFKDLMESEMVCKVFFDPRNDIDAIANQFKIHTKNVLCLQVADVAYRKSLGHRVAYVMGLKKAMDTHIRLSLKLKNALMKIKETGVKLFAPEYGGSYDVFETRPMRVEILNYAAVDVYYFDHLRERLYDTLNIKWKEQVQIASTKRLIEYLEPGYSPKGKEKAIAPRMSIY